MNTGHLRHSAPYLGNLLESIRSLNDFLTPGALRLYQKTLLTTGSFACICPFTGTTCYPNAHYTLPGNGVLYHFNTPDPFILMAASLKDGFPILCVITSQDVVWTTNPTRLDLITRAQKLLQKSPETLTDRGLKPQITIGDPNFAHFLWNEFPALNTAITHTNDFAVNLRFDPLGIMQGFTHQAGLELKQMTHPSEGTGWSKHPSVCLGSTFCNAQTKAKVKALMGLPDQNISPPRIWLSLRDQGRTMENQTTFLNALIAAQHAHDPSTVFLIDGFSTPMDIDQPIYDILRPKFAARIKGAQEIAAKIIANQPQAHIRDMTGVSLHNALSAISTCNFYVSHAGTMQHKPAWFYPLHGLQHGNHASLSPAALRWSAQMVADAIPPYGLPSDIVQDTKVKGLPTQNDRNKDYIVTDIPAAVRCALDHMDALSTAY